MEDDGVTYLLVNGESVDAEQVFPSLIDVQYYPTTVVKKGTEGKIVGSIEAAKKELEQTKDESPEPDAASAKVAYEDMEEDVVDPFHSLF